MDNQIENVIVLSALLSLTKDVVKSVGFEHQAPLSEQTLDEIITSAALEVVGQKVAGGA